MEKIRQNKMENTEHEKLLLRKKNDSREKAQHHWLLLRMSVRSVSKAVEEANMKELEITHGIHRERKLNHDHQILQVLYIPQHKEYITLDGKSCHIFLEDGRSKGMIQVPAEMDRIIYSCQTNQFVGWVQGRQDLYLISKEFNIVSQAKAVGQILMGTYNKSTGELITIGPKFMTCWMFRYGAKYLIPRKTFETNYWDTNMFNVLVLEECTAQSQRIFFAHEKGVVVYNVFSGREIAHKKDLHSQSVTALAYFNPLKYIITGARDGCIKVWDAEWKIKMVFVGHSNQVNILRIYPHGPAFISASHDCTIRVWNLETCDEIDKTTINEPIEGMDTQQNYDVFYTYAGKTVDLWKLQHLYQIHTYIGYPAHSIRVTSHPLFPQRAVVLCQDSSVRIICPSNGEVITTLLMKHNECLIDVAYAIAEDTIFAAMCNGDIVKSLTNCNPCLITSRWKSNSTQEICNCLLVYEYMVDPSGPSDVWSLSKRSVHSSAVTMFNRHKNIKNRTLLLGGRKDGYICVFDWHTGEVTFKAEAHGSKGVLHMIANSKLDQLISAGMDNVIKVWRLYPFAQEALAPLMSFYCAHSPTFMSTIKTSLGVAFQDTSTATFTHVLYSLTDKDRFDHKPDDDHMDVITSLSACPRMKLYATSSMDGTVRIWNKENTLLRVLHLNATPHCLAFCSPHGDLLVGIDKHVFFIPHSKFLPKSQLRKQICMRFSPIKEEQSLEFDENRLNLMDKNDVKRLKSAHASFKYTAITENISLESEETMKEKRKREEGCNLMEMRENEIKQIRDGTLKAQHKQKSTEETHKSAFTEYMKICNKREIKKVPLDEEYFVDPLKKKWPGKLLLAAEEKYRPEEGPFGFFSELGQKFLEQDPESLIHQHYPSCPSGFLPNSVLVRILHPLPQPEQLPWELTPYQPPELTPKQLAEIQSLYRKHHLSEDSDLLRRALTSFDEDHLSRVIEIDYADEEEMKLKSDTSSVISDKSVTRVHESTDGAATAKHSTVSHLQHENDEDRPRHHRSSTAHRHLIQKSLTKYEDIDEDKKENDDEARVSESKQQKPSSLMSKFQNILNKPSPQMKTPEDLPQPPAPPTAAKQTSPVPAHPITKLISHPKPKPKPKTPEPPRSPTPPPPATPLPDYIRRFIGTAWFDKYFPKCNENTLPKPWTSDAFVSMICRLIHVAEWPHKVNVLDAIVSVHDEETLSWPVIQNMVKTLIAVLNHHTSPPICSVPEHKAFILSALKTFAVLDLKEKDVIVEAMVQFLDGDNDVRASVLDLMEKLGLDDPHRKFQKELDSWDIWSIDEQNHKRELHNMSNQWLERWMALYKIRIKECEDLLQQGYVPPRQIFSMRSIKTALDRGGIKELEKKNIVLSHKATQPAVARSAKEGHRPQLLLDSTPVSTGNIHSQSIAETISYVDAVTFFCESVTQKELEALKRGKSMYKPQEDNMLHSKNTVLVLPSISRKPALVRLGEMHTSQCRPERETVLYSECQMPKILMKGKHHAPGDLNRFVSFINLPMKSVYLNPFPSASEERDSCVSHPSLITLQSSQKYFIPSQSYLSVTDYVALGS